MIGCFYEFFRWIYLSLSDSDTDYRKVCSVGVIGCFYEFFRWIYLSLSDSDTDYRADCPVGAIDGFFFQGYRAIYRDDGSCYLFDSRLSP